MARPSVHGKHRVVQTGVWNPPGTGMMRAVWAVCSDAGCSIDGSRKTNQDSYLVDLPRPDMPELLVGVFDGHGEHGHHVSRLCKAQFSELLRTAERSHPNLQSAMTAAYVEQDCACTSTLDCSQSGTTAVTCHLKADELSGRVSLTTAWVGDSRAVLVQVKPDGSVIARDLSVDQNPERPDEKARPATPPPQPATPHAKLATPRPRAGDPTCAAGNPTSVQARIERCGGVCEPVFDERGLPCGPVRVWYLAQVAPGLAMSRSIGDAVGAMVGVTAGP